MYEAHIQHTTPTTHKYAIHTDTTHIPRLHHKRAHSCKARFSPHPPLFVVKVFRRSSSSRRRPSSSSATVDRRRPSVGRRCPRKLRRRNKVSLSLYPPVHQVPKIQAINHQIRNRPVEGKAFGHLKTYPPWPTNDEKTLFGRKQPPETRILAKSSQSSPSQPSPLLQNVPQIRKSQKAQNLAKTPKSGRRKTFSAAVGTHTSQRWLSFEKIPSKFRDPAQIPTPSYPGTCQKSDMSENPNSSIRVEKF